MSVIWSWWLRSATLLCSSGVEGRKVVAQDLLNRFNEEPDIAGFFARSLRAATELRASAPLRQRLNGTVLLATMECQRLGAVLPTRWPLALVFGLIATRLNGV